MTVMYDTSVHVFKTKKIVLDILLSYLLKKSNDDTGCTSHFAQEAQLKHVLWLQTSTFTGYLQGMRMAKGSVSMTSQLTRLFSGYFDPKIMMLYYENEYYSVWRNRYIA